MLRARAREKDYDAALALYLRAWDAAVRMADYREDMSPETLNFDDFDDLVRALVPKRAAEVSQ